MVPPPDRILLEENHRQFRNELLLAQPILPGVLPLLTNATAQGLRLGIASNSPHSWVDRHLQRIGLFDYFHAICCRDDVARGKPEPDVYQHALDRLGVSATEAVAFEDSLPGSEAAKRAGLFCVVAPNPSTRHYTFPHADRRVESLAEVTLESLDNRL